MHLFYPKLDLYIQLSFVSLFIMAIKVILLYKIHRNIILSMIKILNVLKLYGL